jgi:hypothetical protein
MCSAHDESCDVADQLEVGDSAIRKTMVSTVPRVWCEGIPNLFPNGSKSVSASGALTEFDCCVSRCLVVGRHYNAKSKYCKSYARA